jgi:glycosyltransferase involved in cell wall biosynthesis
VRIVHSIQRLRFEDGGPVRAVIDLAEALSARGHQVSILTHDATDAPQSWAGNEDLPTPIVLPNPAIGPLLSRAQLQLADATIEQADVVHLHGIWVPTTAQLAKRAMRFNTPYVVSIRGMLDDWCMAQSTTKKKIYLALGGSRMLNSAARIHLTAQAEYNQARKHFTTQGVVIPNLMDLTPFEPLPGPERAHKRFADLMNADAPVLLFLSRLHYKKGIESLLEASAILDRKGLRHTVLIAGSGDEEYVRSLHAQRERLQASSAHFIGQITGDDKISLYQLADLMVLPTSQENFGFVFYEALAAGTAVLTTKGVDTWPELEASGGGYILPDGESGALASRIEDLLQDRASLHKAGASGREWVFQELNTDALVQRFEALYQEALGRP